MLRYGQGKCSYDEAILEFYHGNVSLARLNSFAAEHWSEDSWASLVCEQAGAIRESLLPLSARKLSTPQVYVFLQAVEFQLKEPGASRSVVLLAAVGMGADGMREVLEVKAAEGQSQPWDLLLQSLKKRGLEGTALFVGENDSAARKAVRRHFPAALYQGCLNQLEADVLSRTPPQLTGFVQERFAAMQEAADQKQAMKEAAILAAKLKAGGAPELAALLAEAAEYQFSYRRFPRPHWVRLCDSMFLKRLVCNVRERVRVLGPGLENEALELMLAARLRHASKQWNERRFIALDEKDEAESDCASVFPKN